MSVKVCKFVHSVFNFLNFNGMKSIVNHYVLQKDFYGFDIYISRHDIFKPQLKDHLARDHFCGDIGWSFIMVPIVLKLSLWSLLYLCHA